MPHAFVRTRLTPSEVAEQLSDEIFNYSDTIIRVRKGFLHLDRQILLLPCFVLEPPETRKFYIQIRQKGPGTLLIRLDTQKRVIKTVGVRLALVSLAKRISQMDTSASVEPGNLKSYFEFVGLDASEQALALQTLRANLSAYLSTAEHREQAKKYTISLHGLEPPFEWNEIFHSSNPVEIEIGPGKGAFLLSQAQGNPEKNFLAIEWAGRYLKILTERLPRRKLVNVRLLAADARTILDEWISRDSVATFHIYYPDPWWKKRHEKHRIFTPKFLQNLQKTLCPGGQLCFATDVEEVFRELGEMIMEATTLVKLHEKIYNSETDPPPGRSNFEIKKWQAGSPIFEAVWQKAEAK